jgi:hypothetical protein
VQTLEPYGRVSVLPLGLRPEFFEESHGVCFASGGRKPSTLLASRLLVGPAEPNDERS